MQSYLPFVQPSAFGCGKKISHSQEKNSWGRVMLWDDEHRSFVVETYLTNGGHSVITTQRLFRRHFAISSHGNVPDRKSILLWVTNFRETGSALLDRKSPGRPRSVRTPDNVEAVKRAVALSPLSSARRHAANLGISDRSFRRILHAEEEKTAILDNEYQGRLKLDKAGKKRKPKDANQPKRATTAYFFFMANCREQAKKAGKNISKVAEFTKECSEKWKNLSPAQRKPFDEKAAKERARYEKEMAEYKGKKSAADPDKPKRPQTSYFLFLAEFRKNYVPKDGQENAAHKMILKEAGEKWREMGAEEKRQYEKMSEEEGKKYKLAMAEYNKKSGGGITGGSAAKKVKVEDSVDDDDDEEDEEEEEEDEVEEDEEEEEEDEEDEDED